MAKAYLVPTFHHDIAYLRPEAEYTARCLEILDEALSSYLTVANVTQEVDAQFQRSKAMLPQYLEMMGISKHEYESRLKTLKTLIKRRPKQVLKHCAGYLSLSQEQLVQALGNAIYQGFSIKNLEAVKEQQ